MRSVKLVAGDKVLESSHTTRELFSKVSQSQRTSQEAVGKYLEH